MLLDWILQDWGSVVVRLDITRVVVQYTACYSVVLAFIVCCVLYIACIVCCVLYIAFIVYDNNHVIS